jgi:drug/metabolite transporter (DMT)-like permease
MNLNVLMLLISTAIWGFGFVAAKMSFESFDPYWTNALRFLVAGGLGLPFLIYLKTFTNKNAPWKEGLIGGSLIFGMLIFQTVGIKYTTIAKSGFITTLYTFFVPLVMMIAFKKRFSYFFWPLVFFALLGVALMCNLDLKDLNLGDFLMFICSIFASFHILYVGHVASHVPSPIEFNFIQNLVVGILGAIVAFIFSGKVDLSPLLNIHGNAFKGIFFLGIISSMLAFSVQVIAQKKIPAHIASLIYLLESPFAALFGWILFNEKLTMMAMSGAVIILISVVLVSFLGKEVAQA